MKCLTVMAILNDKAFSSYLSDFFLQPSRIRVDLLSCESKPTDKREQYNWMDKKNSDGQSGLKQISAKKFCPFHQIAKLRGRGEWRNIPLVIYSKCSNMQCARKEKGKYMFFVWKKPVQFFQSSGCIALVYYSVSSRTIADRLYYNWTAGKIWTGMKTIQGFYGLQS